MIGILRVLLLTTTVLMRDNVVAMNSMNNYHWLENVGGIQYAIDDLAIDTYNDIDRGNIYTVTL